jgi:hypothetical protein
MTTIHAQRIGDKALVSLAELERLVDLAKQGGAIDLQVEEEDVPTLAIMRLAEQGGAFDFWHEEGEDIYSEADGEPV